MKKHIKLFGIVALVAIIAFSFAACDNGGGGGGTDSALDGAWRASYPGGSETITFSGGSVTINDPIYGIQARGSYSTSGGQVTINITEAYLPQSLASGLGATAGWMSKSQWIALLNQNGMSTADLDSIFMSGSSAYSISGNTLTLDGDTYTRQ